VLWLTGGPGCSGLEAFAYENGPFYFPQNMTYLEKNEYSWNKFANMLWFESPPGVGFSKTGTNPNNIKANDYTTADDNYNALKQFFVEFPEYKARDFYISGESYGGVYVPFLATWVQKNHTVFDAKTHINLKGIVVGNGVVNRTTDLSPQTTADFYWWHALYGQETRDLWEDNNCATDWEMKNPNCVSAYATMNTEFNDTNPYDVYRFCWHENNLASPAPERRLTGPYTPWAAWAPFRDDPDGIPCVDVRGST
jgi:carboxypeptidase C (cathepsin A)